MEFEQRYRDAVATDAASRPRRPARTALFRPTAARIAHNDQSRHRLAPRSGSAAGRSETGSLGDGGDQLLNHQLIVSVERGFAFRRGRARGEDQVANRRRQRDGGAHTGSRQPAALGRFDLLQRPQDGDQGRDALLRIGFGGQGGETLGPPGAELVVVERTDLVHGENVERAAASVESAHSFENRHLLVQLTPSLVADVIMSAPQIIGPSPLSAEQLQLQDRITVRLAPVDTSFPSPVRQPRDLVILPQEDAVLKALADAGIRVPTIGESVSAGNLGGQLPARSFIAVPGQAGADVLFLDGAQRDIRVCAAPGAAGRTLYSIFVNGQRATDVDAGQPVFFAAGAAFFVEAYDVATYDALRRGLGLTPGHC